MNLRMRALGLAGLAAACTPPPDFATVEAVVAEFHVMQAEGDDRAAYRTLAADFRNVTTAEDFARLNALARAAPECGPPTRDPSQWRSNMSTSGTFVTVVYHRECANGPLTETFVLRATESGPQIAGYHLSGMALVPSATPSPPDQNAPALPDAVPTTPT